MMRAPGTPMRCVEIVKAQPIEPLRSHAVRRPAIFRGARPGLAAIALALVAAMCAGNGLRLQLSKFEFRLVSTSLPYQAGRPGAWAAAPRQAGALHAIGEGAAR